MSKRIKETNLFNKNHIRIVRIDNCENNYQYYEFNSKCEDNSYGFNRSKIYDLYDEVKCVSPLGFYYTKRVYRTQKHFFTKYRELVIKLSTQTYVLTYVKGYNGTYIGNDIRPWEIYEGEKSMKDHMITSLMNEINKLLDIISENKLQYNPYKEDNYKPSLDNLRKIIYKEVFGSEKGIRFQTDQEKILSHGFDLKTSFRKQKDGK